MLASPDSDRGQPPRAGKLGVALVVDVKVGPNWRDMQ